MQVILKTVLLVFVAAALGYFAWERVGASASATPAASEATVALAQPHAVVVTYFTTDQRCTSCLQIEQLTRLALAEQFAAELDQGLVRFETHNLDRPENRHFARDYQLAFKTVVVSNYRDGREVSWQKMDEVWRLLSRPGDFKAYVATQVRDYLGS
jgi:hypothetical protein